MLPFLNVVKADFDAVNQLIVDELSSNVALIGDIGNHLINAGGKRLRPIVALLGARACGYDGDKHLLLAAVVEFIHTATLLHDDVVDTSELRRGRYTANVEFGNAASVLVGDFIYSRAFQLMVKIGDMSVMEVLADATNTISEGEVQQLVNAGNPDISEQQYEQVIDKKTAVLFEAAGRTSAILADAKEQEVKALQSYGRHLGMAFQLVDDALDYSGGGEQLGKNVGDDLAEGKATLPLIYAMRTANTADSELIRSAILNKGSADLQQILTVIHQTEALDYTLAKAREQTHHALVTTEELPPSNEREALIKLAEFAVDRQY